LIKDVLKQGFETEHTPKVFFQDNFSLLMAIEALVAFNVHRLAVSNHLGQCVGVLTQSMLVNYLSDAIESNLGLLDTKIQCLRPYQLVQSVNENMVTIHALEKISHLKLYSLAVVNNQGCLTSQLSVKNLKRILPFQARFGLLWTSVKQYLATYVDTETSEELCMIDAHTGSLRQVLRLMKTCRAHRVFLITPHGTPVDVITMTDILRFIWQCPDMIETANTQALAPARGTPLLPKDSTNVRVN
jgi:CBS-domain-containing membrane protein